MLMGDIQLLMLKTASTQKLIEYVCSLAKAHSFLSFFKEKPHIIQFVCLMKSFNKGWIKWYGMKSECSQKKTNEIFHIHLFFLTKRPERRAFLSYKFKVVSGLFDTSETLPNFLNRTSLSPMQLCKAQLRPVCLR